MLIKPGFYNTVLATGLALLVSCNNSDKSKADSSAGEQKIPVENKREKLVLDEFSKSMKNGTHGFAADSVLMVVYDVFPEAYKEFAEVTYRNEGFNSFPVSVSFLVTEKIVNKKFTDEELEKRSAEIMKRFQLNGCHGINKGEASNYAFSAWKDKRVVRLKFFFGIGC